LKGQWKSTGDPTEVALQVFAGKLGLGRAELTGEGPEAEERVLRPAMGKVIDYGVPEHERAPPKEKKPARFVLKSEFPFSSDLKRMTTIYTDKEDEDSALVLIKGAVRLVPF
jgi:magnesium-transporting ATPase (P-type)